MNNFAGRMFGSFVRHGATALGGWMVGQGYVDEQSASTAIGAFVALGGVGWSAFEKATR